MQSRVRWIDGQPGTELNFKLYRQATGKIVGISEGAAVFLDTFVDDPPAPPDDDVAAPQR